MAKPIQASFPRTLTHRTWNAKNVNAKADVSFNRVLRGFESKVTSKIAMPTMLAHQWFG
jgi:hypothetical protein